MLTYNKSQAGRWHTAESIPCQDSSATVSLQDGGSAIIIADGLGSCEHSDKGSKQAVSTASALLAGMRVHGTGKEALEVARAYIQVAFAEAESSIERMAVADGNPIDDYLTTLSIAYFNGRNLVWGHAGDGAIVAMTSFGTVCKLTEEDNGESSSIVYPLQAGPQHWSFGVDSMEEYAGVIAVTDGLLEALQPQLLRGGLYDRLCAFVFEAGSPLDAEKGMTSAEKLFSFEETGCVLFDLWSREIQRGSAKSEGLLRDDLSLAAAINPELMALVDAEYAEPDWLKLAIALSEDLAQNDACNASQE